MQEVPFEGEEVANLLVRYESGARGVLSLSHVAAGHPYRVQFEIDASECGVGWDSEAPNELWIGHRGRPNELVIPDARQLDPAVGTYADATGAFREGFSNTFEMLFRHVYAQIGRSSDGRPEPDYPTFKDGYAGLLVHEAVMQSAREQCWIEVDWSALDRRGAPATQG